MLGTQKRMRISGGQPSSQGEEIIDFAADGPSLLTVNWPNGKVSQQMVTPPTQMTIEEP
jgi:hypothetical protein